MKTINDIKQAVNNGQTVYWKNKRYKVMKDNFNRYMINAGNGSIVELKDDYNPKDFFKRGQ